MAAEQRAVIYLPGETLIGQERCDEGFGCLGKKRNHLCFRLGQEWQGCASMSSRVLLRTLGHRHLGAETHLPGTSTELPLRTCFYPRMTGMTGYSVSGGKYTESLPFPSAPLPLYPRPPSSPLGAGWLDCRCPCLGAARGAGSVGKFGHLGGNSTLPGPAMGWYMPGTVLFVFLSK